MSKERQIIYLLLTTDWTDRRIARWIGASHNTVARYRRILSEKQKDWPDIVEMDDASIDLMFKGVRARKHAKRKPSWSEVFKEMKYPGVTLYLIWEGYRAIDPNDAYCYSQFAYLYRKYCDKLNLSMRLNRRAGECVFVDFAGKTISYKNPKTGENIPVQIFVSAIGISGFTFVYAVHTQSSPDWIDANNKMLRFYGGVTLVIVCDNLKAAVITPGDVPKLNPTYLEFAVHNRTTILPARPYHAQDKAIAEEAVQNVERCVLAPLRHRKFFSIDEINAAIQEHLSDLNERPFQKISGCRRSWFEEYDKPLLQPLPAEPYEYAEWISAQKIASDYHIRVKDHYYSVPYILVGERVEARVTKHLIELFHGGRRVASHFRSYALGESTTDPMHQTNEHRHYAQLTPELFLKWAEQIGASTSSFVRFQFENKRTDLPGKRACSSLQKLEKRYGAEMLEAACQHAEAIRSLTISSVRSILQSNILNRTEEDNPVQTDLPLHDNVRGSAYYVNRSA